MLWDNLVFWRCVRFSQLPLVCAGATLKGGCVRIPSGCEDKTIPALSTELACQECRLCIVFVLTEPVLDLVIGQKGQQIDIE